MKSSRPRLKYLDSKIKRLEADLKMQNAENMPKLGLFATGGYGKSGLNTFDRGFQALFYWGGDVKLEFWKIEYIEE